MITYPKQHKTMNKILWFCFLLFFLSCKKDRNSIPDKPTHQISIQRFDQTFYQTGTSSDSAFLDLYANNIMKVGEPGTQLFRQFDSIFRTDNQMRQIYTDCQQTFKDVAPIEAKLTLAFSRLHFLFPDIPYPKVYMHISGFGESIVSGPEILSASIDKYLGTNYSLYQTLFYPYQIQRMYPNKIVADYMTGWVRSEFSEESLMSQNRLIDYLLYEGKILYFIKVLLPEEPMEDISGFSKEQIDWCSKNEKNMWNYILKHQHLYSPDPLVIAKYIKDAPHTTFFPEKAPGRAAIWIGYKIAEAYIETHPEISIQDFLLNTNNQAIVSESMYRP